MALRFSPQTARRKRPCPTTQRVPDGVSRAVEWRRSFAHIMDKPVSPNALPQRWRLAARAVMIAFDHWGGVRRIATPLREVASIPLAFLFRAVVSTPALRGLLASGIERLANIQISSLDKFFRKSFRESTQALPTGVTEALLSLWSAAAARSPERAVASVLPVVASMNEGIVVNFEGLLHVASDPTVENVRHLMERKTVVLRAGERAILPYYRSLINLDRAAKGEPLLPPQAFSIFGTAISELKRRGIDKTLFDPRIRLIRNASAHDGVRVDHATASLELHDGRGAPISFSLDEFVRVFFGQTAIAACGAGAIWIGAAFHWVTRNAGLVDSLRSEVKVLSTALRTGDASGLTALERRGESFVQRIREELGDDELRALVEHLRAYQQRKRDAM